MVYRVLRPSSVVAIIVLVAFDAGAERITALVWDFPYETNIDLEGFEPWPVLPPNTILGGETKDGSIITIIAEEETAALTPTQVRDKYVKPGTPGTEGHTRETMETDGLAIVLDPGATDAAVIKADAYTSKDKLSFDIHLSVPAAAQAKERILKVFKSFEVKPSDEPPDMSLFILQYGHHSEPAQCEEFLKDFVKKHPRSAWAYAMLGIHYSGWAGFGTLSQEAKAAYLRAIENHRVQPLMIPELLWTCYEKLGVHYGMAREHEQAKGFLEKAYEVARAMNREYEQAKGPLEKAHAVARAISMGYQDFQGLQATSAYNLACSHAEMGDAQKAIEYLKEAVTLDSEYKREAKDDPSFERVRGTPAFLDVVAK